METDCCTIPGSGVCITVKAAKSEVELDLPDTIFEKVIKSVVSLKD